jgi:hypothetical protein
MTPDRAARLTIEKRQEFLRLQAHIAERTLDRAHRACLPGPEGGQVSRRDSLYNGEPHLIIIGDTELLVLNPFRSIDILTPASYPAR